MTGFGRTGRNFASDHLKLKPDIMCMSKGLTGGFLPLGATSCAPFIYEKFLTSDRTKTFFHGHSYTANPLACVAALASLELLQTASCQTTIKLIGEINSQLVEQLTGNRKVKDVRSIGTIVAIELETQGATHYLNEVSILISEYFVNEKIILRPLGNVFYLIPPYVITEPQLRFMHDKVLKFIDDYVIR